MWNLAQDERFLQQYNGKWKYQFIVIFKSYIKLLLKVPYELMSHLQPAQTSQSVALLNYSYYYYTKKHIGHFTYLSSCDSEVVNTNNWANDCLWDQFDPAKHTICFIKP